MPTEVHPRGIDSPPHARSRRGGLRTSIFAYPAWSIRMRFLPLASMALKVLLKSGLPACSVEASVDPDGAKRATVKASRRVLG
jgi:hypothetical protein